jgi:hypothetical protein
VDGELPLGHGTKDTLHLNNVALLDATQLRQRLLSVGGLTSAGYVIVFALHHCYVLNPEGKIVLAIEKKDNLYPVDLDALNGIGPSRLEPLKEDLLRRALGVVRAAKAKRSHGPAPEVPKIQLAALLKELPTDYSDLNLPKVVMDFTRPQLPSLACLAKVYCNTSNFKLTLHRRFAHASLSEKSQPLYKACAALYGKRFTDCPPFHCSDWYLTKAHSLIRGTVLTRSRSWQVTGRMAGFSLTLSPGLILVKREKDTAQSCITSDFLLASHTNTSTRPLASSLPS